VEKFLKFMLWAMGIFLAFCGLGRLLLFETWIVPADPYISASVEPTLSAGDQVLVLTVGESSFGDLVRCPDPDDNTRFVVGRVSALDGDDLELSGHTLRVNGSRYDASDACVQPMFSVANPDTGHEVELQCARTDMGGGWHYRATGKYIKSDDTKKHVGAEKVFLLSDNRGMHEDSRDFGSLPHADCHHRIVFRLWGGDGWSDVERRMTFIR
jgi:signal peptidase I